MYVRFPLLYHNVLFIIIWLKFITIDCIIKNNIMSMRV